jgi:hypothetical protein
LRHPSKPDKTLKPTGKHFLQVSMITAAGVFTMAASATPGVVTRDVVITSQNGEGAVQGDLEGGFTISQVGPRTMSLIGAGLIGLGLCRRRRIGR